MKKRLVNIDILKKEIKNGAKILFCKKASKIKSKRTIKVTSLLSLCNFKQKNKLINTLKQVK